MVAILKKQPLSYGAGKQNTTCNYNSARQLSLASFHHEQNRKTPK